MVEHEYNTSHLNIILNNSIHSATHMLTHLIESVVLVLEAGYEARIDLQGVVVSSQLEWQGRVTLFLKAPVGIQYLHTNEQIVSKVQKKKM